MVFDRAILFISHNKTMKIFIKRYSALLFVSFALLLLISSCQKHDPDVIVRGESKIKFVNATQTETEQEVYVDDQIVPNTALAFGGNTDYFKAASGNRNIKYAGSSGISTQLSFNFTPSITYSAFLVADRSGNREILTYEDNLGTTGQNMAKIRLINLTPYYTTGINVSLLAGTQFVNALLYKESTNYFSVDTGVALRYTVVGGGTIKTIAATELEAGKIYTIWFSGTTAATIEAHIVMNN